MNKTDIGIGVAGVLIAVAIALVISAISALIIGAIGMWLWNWLAVSLFGANPIGYWPAVGVCFALAFLRNLIFPKTTVNVKD